MVAGEASGDLYGAQVARLLMEKGVGVYGIGGEEMEGAGVELLYRCEDLAVVGISEALGKIMEARRASEALMVAASQRETALAILIDFPDFNLWMAKLLRKRGIPILYYVSPQVWAWRRGRVKKIARRVDRMAVILPFEEELYRKVGLEVEFVGHPLLDILNQGISKEEARGRLGYPYDVPVVALLPGSRKKEIRRLLPPMLGACEILKGSFPSLRFLLLLAPTISREEVGPFLRRHPRLEVKVVDGRVEEVMRAADAMIVASGTATLQGALLGTPMVIVYKVSLLSALVASLLIRVRYIGLPNLILGRGVVPELLQLRVTPERIAREVASLLTDRKRREEMERGFSQLRSLLRGGASERVAEMAMELMEAA